MSGGPGLSVRRFLRGPLGQGSYATESCRSDFISLYNLCTSGRSSERKEVGDDVPLQAVKRLPAYRLPGALHAYQQELVDSLRRIVCDGRPLCALLALPTGAGKTRTALTFVLDWLADTRCPHHVLWLAPTLELLDQAADAFEAQWYSSSRSRGICLFRRLVDMSQRGGVDHSITFATVQGLLSAFRRGLLPEDYDFAVYDEAHQAAAPATSEVIARLVEARRTSVLGLSATPGRTNPDESATLAELFGRSLLTAESLRPNAVRSLQASGMLANLTFKAIDIPGLLVGQRRTGGASVGGRIMQALALDGARFRACVEAVRLECELGRRVLIFAASVTHACALAAACRALGVSATAISGLMHPLVRQRALDEFRSGSTRALCNSRLLMLGYDLPALDSVLITVPITSPIMFEQVVGRVSRGPASGGKEMGYVLDLDDHLRMHGLPSSYHRFEDFDWERYRSA